MSDKIKELLSKATKITAKPGEINYEKDLTQPPEPPVIDYSKLNSPQKPVAAKIPNWKKKLAEKAASELRSMKKDESAGYSMPDPAQPLQKDDEETPELKALRARMKEKRHLKPGSTNDKIREALENQPNNPFRESVGRRGMQHYGDNRPSKPETPAPEQSASDKMRQRIKEFKQRHGAVTGPDPSTVTPRSWDNAVQDTIDQGPQSGRPALTAIPGGGESAPSPAKPEPVLKPHEKRSRTIQERKAAARKERLDQERSAYEQIHGKELADLHDERPMDAGEEEARAKGVQAHGEHEFTGQHDVRYIGEVSGRHHFTASDPSHSWDRDHVVGTKGENGWDLKYIPSGGWDTTDHQAPENAQRIAARRESVLNSVRNHSLVQTGTMRPFSEAVAALDDRKREFRSRQQAGQERKAAREAYAGAFGDEMASHNETAEQLHQAKRGADNFKDADLHQIPGTSKTAHYLGEHNGTHYFHSTGGRGHRTGEGYSFMRQGDKAPTQIPPASSYVSAEDTPEERILSAKRHGTQTWRGRKMPQTSAAVAGKHPKALELAGKKQRAATPAQLAAGFKARAGKNWGNETHWLQMEGTGHNRGKYRYQRAEYDPTTNTITPGHGDDESFKQAWESGAKHHKAFRDIASKNPTFRSRKDESAAKKPRLVSEPTDKSMQKSDDNEATSNTKRLLESVKRLASTSKSKRPTEADRASIRDIVRRATEAKKAK